MKAVVFHDIADVRLDDVAEPALQERTDAIVRLTASAICGTDLHMLRGTMPGMKPVTILGVGIVEEIGPDVRNLCPGDRVVIGSTLDAALVPIVVRAISRSVTEPTSTDRPPVRRSSAALR